ncbi:glycosyltransferase family protein [Paenibacillus sp. sgz500958]|uniref:glycosyltransferase family protein n=1 Tax=Paenibacillus sp. sgz500958 TaxID=3242475 RepID=UPI0036D35527
MSQVEVNELLMDSDKICFIYCVNQFHLLKESMKYLSALFIPEGINVEVLTIANAKSMASGYNEALSKTNAKYKVYLHQDVYILNPNFIVDVLNIFQQNAKLGLFGVIGSRYLPSSGMWWESADNYGQVFGSHSGTMELLAFNNCEPGNACQRVTAVDGLLMITQADILWREDLFPGWHYYDISQCMEFSRAGYEIGVAFQDTPWALHDCGVADLSGFEENRVRFIQEYQEEMREKFAAYYHDRCKLSLSDSSFSRGIDLSLLKRHLDEYGLNF